MRLAIDIDGCMNEEVSAILQYGREFFNREPIIDNTIASYDITYAFQCTKEEEIAFIKKYNKELAYDVPAMRNVGKVIRRLQQLGMEIHIVTSRGCSEGAYTPESAEAFLKKNNIPYDKLVLIKDKAGYAVENAIDLAVDDSPHNIRDYISRGIPIITFDYPFTKQFTDIPRVSTWRDLFIEIISYFGIDVNL